MLRSNDDCQKTPGSATCIYKEPPLPSGSDVEQSCMLSLFADQLSSQMSSMERNVNKAQDLHQRVLVRGITVITYISDLILGNIKKSAR